MGGIFNPSSTFAKVVKRVRKTIDETVNNSAVLQNDNELLFAIKANEIWAVEFLLMAVVGTGNLRTAISAPAGATGYRFYANPNSGASSVIYTVADLATAQISANATPDGLMIKVIVTNGAVAGNVTLQWAQFTATVEDTKILANSYLIAHQLP